MIAAGASVGALHGADRQPAFVPLDDGCEARIVFEPAVAPEKQEITREPTAPGDLDICRLFR
jgi:hypothetical protein